MEMVALLSGPWVEEDLACFERGRMVTLVT